MSNLPHFLAVVLIIMLVVGLLAQNSSARSPSHKVSRRSQRILWTCALHLAQGDKTNALPAESFSPGSVTQLIPRDASPFVV